MPVGIRHVAGGDCTTTVVVHRRDRRGSVLTIPSIPELAKYKRRADKSNRHNRVFSKAYGYVYVYA